MHPDCTPIPVHRRDGSICAYVIVDAEDAEWASQRRWHLNTGYAARSIKLDGKWRIALLHRELLGLPYVSDGREGDHCDRDKLNCRRSNLRIIDHAHNPQNVSSHRDATSRHRGVSWDRDRKKWAVRVYAGGKQLYFGCFDDEDAAARVAQDARANLMPYTLS